MQDSQKQDFLQNKAKIEEAIDSILKKTYDEKTKGSRECKQILDQLYEIQPLLKTVDDSIKDVNQDKLQQLYKTFRNLFKSFKEDVSETSKMINDNTFDKDNKINKEKMKQVIERIKNMKQELENLKNKIFVPYKKYLVWIDYNIENDESLLYLIEFINICNGAIEIHIFDNNEDFRNFVVEHSDQMLYIIMSGSAAGESFEWDGKNLKWIKQLIQQKSSSEFIYGIYIFTSYEGEKYFKPLIKSEKGLVLDVTSNPKIISENLRNLIFPKKCIRVLPVVKLCEFLDKELMELEIAFKIIEDQKIGIDQNILNNNIYQSLFECFRSQDNSQIAESILKLYTQETNFYKFINSLLSVLNQDLIIIFWDLILCFRAALNVYDDSKFSQIQPPKMINNQYEERKAATLYRGVAIPKESFEQLYKVDQYICMCGFSSFSTDLNIALKFSQKGQGIRVIFKVDYECGNQQYPLRPKCLSELSEYDEKEYLMNCGTVFRIKSIQEEIEDNNVIKYINLIL
ncbi:hypothetical protein TTHERM_01141520 (macronuclear) [Tetrahymena thermophila SB210]|uniref:Uncharacterized protein n=1 Tax=Tetrahymena thermophila (strain SB210) TaxID=312017 RepID=Q22AZ7_TETTS|nr:hypothetical protein TTHERM_01141520 [Tetrahymena thermophila SB210]EAR82461.3 hypothetical protein TTHERM_01141520 [Tetrahymena thermophila SB210]|eukprot:XP_001030124.3 hypothetical protein TTHERM_01141520 [Tetrahymena thermophila SB210]